MSRYLVMGLDVLIWLDHKGMEVRPGGLDLGGKRPGSLGVYEPRELEVLI